MCARHTDLTTHNLFAILIMYRLLLGHLPEVPILVPRLEYMRFATTNLIVKEGIPDVFHYSRYSLNIIFTFLIPHNVHTIVECAPTISDKPESAMGEGKYNYRLE